MWIDGVAGKVRSRWCVLKSMASYLSGLRERPLIAEPRLQSGQACFKGFKVRHGGASSCTFKTDIELSIIGILLMRNAEVGNYLTDEWNVQWEKNRSKDGALWHTRETNGWFRCNRANTDSLCAIFEIRCQPSKCSASHTKAIWESWKNVLNGQWYQKQRWDLRRQVKLVDCDQRSKRYHQKFEGVRFLWSGEADRRTEGGWILEKKWHVGKIETGKGVQWFYKYCSNWK